MNCLADRFTLTVSGRAGRQLGLPRSPAGGRLREGPSMPIGTIRPVSSATGMKSAGTPGRDRQCCQRTSASKPSRSAARKRDDRLVVQLELAAARWRGADRSPVGDAPSARCAHARCRTLRAGLARGPWPGTSRCRRRAARPRANRSRARSSRCRRWRTRTPHGRRCGTARPVSSMDPLGHAAWRRATWRMLVEQDGELVAAEAGDRVLGVDARERVAGPQARAPGAGRCRRATGRR